MGECLAKGVISHKLEKVYKNSSDQSDNRAPLQQITTLEQVIQELKEIKDGQNEMEDEIKLLREDNEAKAIEIEALKCELAYLHRKTALLEASNSSGGDYS